MKPLIYKDTLAHSMDREFAALEKRGNQGIVFGIQIDSDISTITVEVPVRLDGIEFANYAGIKYAEMVRKMFSKRNYADGEGDYAYKHNIEDEFTAKAVEGIIQAYARYWSS